MRQRTLIGPSPLLLLFLVICIGLASVTLYFFQVQAYITAGDVAYRRARWSEAEQAYQTALHKMDWLGDNRIQCSDGSLLFARSLIMEKIALAKSSQGQYTEAIPYFDEALKNNESQFKSCFSRRAGSELVVRYYFQAQDVRRVLWNYSQVLISLHREEEAKRLKQSVWSDLLALCKDARRRRLERQLVSREAQLLLYEGFTPEGTSLTRQLAEIERLPNAIQEDKLLPLLSVTVPPRSNPPLFDTLGVVPQ